MKFSKDTLNVFRNFATINPKQKFVKGNILTTLSTSQTLAVTAILEDEITDDFSVGELNEFVTILNATDDPVVKIDNDVAIIKDASQEFKYKLYASEYSQTIPYYNPQSIDTENFIKFELSKNNIETILKNYALISADTVAFEGIDGVISVTAEVDKGSTYRLEIADDVKFDSNFKAIVSVEDLKFVKMDYEVAVSVDEGIIILSNSRIKYQVALDENSWSEE